MLCPKKIYVIFDSVMSIEILLVSVCVNSDFKSYAGFGKVKINIFHLNF